MPQNTNAIAYQKLKPLQNDNFGALALEHIKYLKEVKRQEEADAYKRKLQENEIQRQLGKDVSTYLDGLPNDSAGYWQYSNLQYLEKNKDKFYDLSLKAANGDTKAIFELEREKRKLQNLQNLGNTASQYIEKLNKDVQTGNYNPYLDKDKVELVKSLKDSKYIIDDKTGNIRIYSADGNKVLYDSTPETLNVGLTQLTFNKTPDYAKIGADIAKDIKIPTIDGVQDVSKAELQAIERWKNKLKDDDKLLETSLLKYDYDVSDGIDDVFLTSLAYDISKDYTNSLLNIKTKSKELAELEKKQKEATLANTKARTYRTYNPIPPKPREMSVTEKRQIEKDNAIRRYVDRILAGDTVAIETAVKQQPKNSKAGYTSSLEYKNGKLYQTLVIDGEEQVNVIDTNDPSAIGQVLQIIEPFGSPTDLYTSYSNGEPEKNLIKNKNRGLPAYQKKEILSIVDEDDMKEYLESLGIKDITIPTNWNNKIKIGNKLYLLSNKKDKDKLLQYVESTFTGTDLSKDTEYQEWLKKKGL